jgi:hypothetical protein
MNDLSLILQYSKKTSQDCKTVTEVNPATVVLRLTIPFDNIVVSAQPVWHFTVFQC